MDSRKLCSLAVVLLALVCVDAFAARYEELFATDTTILRKLKMYSGSTIVDSSGNTVLTSAGAFTPSTIVASGAFSAASVLSKAGLTASNGLTVVAGATSLGSTLAVNGLITIGATNATAPSSAPTIKHSGTAAGYNWLVLRGGDNGQPLTAGTLMLGSENSTFISNCVYVTIGNNDGKFVVGQGGRVDYATRGNGLFRVGYNGDVNFHSYLLTNSTFTVNATNGNATVYGGLTAINGGFIIPSVISNFINNADAVTTNGLPVNTLYRDPNGVLMISFTP